MEAAVVLGLLVVAVALFVTERFPVDVITLLLLTALMLAGILTPGEALSGFASEVIVILAALSVICGALNHTGILDLPAAWLSRLARHGTERLAACFMGSAAAVSAFMNNTAVTAMMLPAADRVAHRTGVSTSKLMMPLAFGSILGGTCTLIGTSTNIAVSGYLAKTGLAPLSLFELAPVGLVIAGAGIFYMLTIGSRLLPDRRQDMVTPSETLRDYLCEIEVLPNSPLIGEQTFDWELLLVDFRILQLRRDGRTLAPGPDVTIAPGDILLVEGRVDNLIRIQAIEGIRIRTQVDVSELLDPRALSIAEVVVLPGSQVIGHTLGEADFRKRFGLMVLAINRIGRQLLDHLRDQPLSAGDVLLVKGSREDVEALRSRDRALVPLGEHAPPARGTWRGWLLLGCFLSAILASTTLGVPLAAGLLATALLAVLTGALTAERAREAVDWRLLILIGGMTGFGVAMQESGAAQLLADWVTAAIGPLGPYAVMVGFIILTILLTQPMSNAAAALVVLPIALATAAEIGADPRSFGIAIMLAASISFITPFEPSCLLVYGPGHYRFRDFVVVGGGLTVLSIFIMVLLVPLVWPLV